MESAPVIRRVRPSFRPFTGRKRSTGKQISQRTPVIDNNGFLNHSFQPFWGINTMGWKQTEREFFNSLSNLCSLYHWPLPDTAGIEFPQNIASAYAGVKELLKKQELDCIIINDKKRKVCLATVKSFDTGYCLYYIPVRPLWLLLKDKEQDKLSEVIIHLFRYLYHIAGVPYYRENTYLYNQYEILTEWIENDADDEDDTAYRQHQAAEMKQLKDAGDEIFPVLKSPFDKSALQKAISAYGKCSNCDKEIIELAKRYLKLYQDFPSRSIHHSLHQSLLHPDESEYIYLEQYLSFYWSGNDDFYDSLMDMINSHLQEMGFQDEPTSLQYFDRPQEKEMHDFHFEQRFFDLIDGLTELLNKYDKVNKDITNDKE